MAREVAMSIRTAAARPMAAGAAVGFRVKSGWAAVVLLGGPRASPRVLDRRTAELSDPAVPETRQPYHGGRGREETDAAKVERRVALVRRAARAGVGALLREYGAGGGIRGAGLVVGSMIDPASIANPHIRAHAQEGRLFRTVVEEALGACGVRCHAWVEREAYGAACAALGRGEADLRRALAELGRALGPPWGGDEKMAALAAWMVL